MARNQAQVPHAQVPHARAGGEPTPTRVAEGHEPIDERGADDDVPHKAAERGHHEVSVDPEDAAAMRALRDLQDRSGLA